MLLGADEAGRGAWAGPLVAAVVCLRPHKKFQHPLLRDSKKLSANQRRGVFDYVLTICDVGVGVVTAKEIDEMGLQKANVVAVERAIKNLLEGESFDFQSLRAQRSNLVRRDLQARLLRHRVKRDILAKTLVIDYIGGFKKYTTLEQNYSLHKFGEQKFPEIAAASIIAKVTRDSMMEKLSKQYPLYRFELHKGYGTKIHQQQLEAYGPSSIHRQTFSPVKRK